MTVVRGRREDGDRGYEDARSGTIYWTLSLYIEADKVVSALKPKPGKSLGRRIEPDIFRRMQRGHLPSLALANAVDPLMNDIADRESQGEVREFLLAAAEGPAATMGEAAETVREHEPLIFKLPPSTSWTTEGVRFQASPANLAHEREVRLRRFWLSHNNGALSYHLSFSHYYGTYVDEAGRQCSGYDPSTYYFLSLLQKLAAPKEYALRPESLAPTDKDPDPSFDVFQDNLGIDPLDNIKVAFRSETEGLRFWPFVKAMFEDDARTLFTRLGRVSGADVRIKTGDYTRQLIDLVPFIEVPGLKAPKSRFMFMLHDGRFFDRLMPFDTDTKAVLPRKAMVREDCYAPYEARIGALMEDAERRKEAAVHLDGAYWDWVCRRPEYESAVRNGELLRANSQLEVGAGEARNRPFAIDETAEAPEIRLADLATAMRTGVCEQTHDLEDPAAPRPAEERRMASPARRHIPAFAANRADCLDYLFLAGFNQNIIDFMNQDTSEILDSIDPIYPENDEQSDERFFVRYANHRAMVTYAPRSRSLETGNDYIGACPYAFLIHALALHNEFLARGHEQKTMTRIERIEAMAAGESLPATLQMTALQENEPLLGSTRFDKAEMAINQAKLATFDQYERFRHDNPFRYDTERAVFKKLEELRGISRKKDALTLAIDSLEDHAADLQRIHQRKIDAGTAQRGALLNILLGGTGLFGAGQMFYWIGEKAAGERGDNGKMEKMREVQIPVWDPPQDTTTGETILSWTEIAMTTVLVGFVALLALYAGFALVQAIVTFKAALKEPNYDTPRKR